MYSIRTRNLVRLGIATLLSVGVSWVVAETVTTEQQTAAAQLPTTIPDEARRRPNPREATAQSVAKGKLVYGSQCTMCHGKSGAGDGDLVARLKLEMPDLTNAQRQKSRTDGELFYVLTHGHGRMSGEGDRLDENMRWDIVNYLRSLEKPD